MSVFYSFMGNNIDSNWVYLPDKMLSYEFPFGLNIALTLAVILVLLFVTIYTVFLYFNNKKKADEKENRWKEQVQFSEFQKALTEIEKNTVQLENTNLTSQLDNKQKELITYSINIGEQRQYLDSIYKSLQRAINSDSIEEKNAILTEELTTIKQKMTYSTELENIYQQAEQVHISFMEKLNSQYPDLSAQEKRLMMLLRIGLSSKEIAPLLNISIKSVEISRYRLRKKLNLQKNTNLIQFTKNL
ncbi:MAG: helix-turn-helix transcriptional regulator [Paludibacteraceae bacterium]